MSEDGFLSRWARRKAEVREGKAVEAEPAPVVQPEPLQPPSAPSAAAAETAPPLPTLEDAQALTPDSDFRRFVTAEVPPDVKNAALKKLFADPRFNVMDGLDTYIDDYSKPDPLPPEMLRQLASAAFLKLFDEDDKQEDSARNDPAPRDAADAPPAASVAESAQEPGPGDREVPPADDHADPDLRLQQDHAAGPPGPRQGGG